MQKKPTIYDIAKELNVTISTVSRALNNSDLISEETKGKVMETARKLNYRPNKVASSLSSGRSYVVGVIVPNAQIQFFSAVINSLEQTLQKEGYSVLLYQSNESAQADISGIQTFIEARVDGIIISPSLETYNFDFFNKAHAEGMPIVQFDRIDDSLNLPSVAIDDEKGGFIATKHLIDQGYKRIAYISTSSKIQIFRNRYKGYLRALEESGIPVVDEMVIRDELSIQGGILGTRKLMAMDSKPDAIIGGDDFAALGIIKELSQMALTPPKVGVIGFANQTFSEYITPGLSTIDQQAKRMGKECANLFLKLVHKKRSNKSVEKVVLDPILVERESSLRK